MAPSIGAAADAPVTEDEVANALRDLDEEERVLREEFEEVLDRRRLLDGLLRNNPGVFDFQNQRPTFILYSKRRLDSETWALQYIMFDLPQPRRPRVVNIR